MKRVIQRGVAALLITPCIGAGLAAKSLAATAPVSNAYGAANFVPEQPWWQASTKDVTYPTTFTLSSDVLFASGSATLSIAAASQLVGVEAAAKARPTMMISVDGYTDSVPDRALPGGNLELSQQRCAAIKQVLESDGIAASRVIATGHGAADPVAPNTPTGQPANRRVTITLRAQP